MPTALLALVLIALAAPGNGQKEKPVLSEEIVEIIQHVHNQCVQKIGVAEEDISNCENGIFKEDNKLKCYMFCLLEEGNLVDENDNVDYDMMISLIPEEYTQRVTNMINSCKHHDVPTKDKCQRAFDVHKCSYEKDPKIDIVRVVEEALHSLGLSPPEPRRTQHHLLAAILQTPTASLLEFVTEVQSYQIKEGSAWLSHSITSYICKGKSVDAIIRIVDTLSTNQM